MLAARLCVAAAFAAATEASKLSSQIGATHWDPCYYTDDTVPVLLNGAQQLATMGTTAIKMVLSADPPYHWNTLGPGAHAHWNLTGYSTLAQLAAHPWYAAVFNNTLGTSYDTFVLVTYRFGTGLYFCQPPVTDANMTAEAEEYAALTTYLMQTYGGRGYRFIYQHWEGDWAARCGGYNASQPVQPAVQQAMIRWLQGRQTGTSQGRQQYCREHMAMTGVVDCSDERAIMAAAGVEVYHASEVNLVGASMRTGAPNNILEVIPHVALDMVSYSSYDTMATPQFGLALDFIAQHHNRSSAAPTPAVYVGEYGLAQMKNPLSSLQSLLPNVLGFGLSPSPVYDGGAARAAHIMFWELFDNEAPCMPSQRCEGTTPVFDTSCLNGFWLVLPNNTLSWAWGYLQGVINGTIPVPTPPAAAPGPLLA